MFQAYSAYGRHIERFQNSIYLKRNLALIHDLSVLPR